MFRESNHHTSRMFGGALWAIRISANDQWIPPHGELITVNFDGAFDKDCFQSCFGIVARNAGGRVLVSRTVLHENVASAFAAEAL